MNIRGRQSWNRAVLLAALAAAGVIHGARSQTADEAQATAPVLHAYANLVQIPVLVLTEKRLRAPALLADQFRLSLDSGPWFAPRHVRREGTDPIRLAILLVPGPNTTPVLQDFESGVPDLAASLTEADTVSVSILQGCSLVQTSDVSATPPNLLRLGQFVTRTVGQAGEPASASNRPVPVPVPVPAPVPQPAPAKPSPAPVPAARANGAGVPPSSPAKAATGSETCTSAPRLWDATRMVLRRLDKGAERRVLLVVADGEDRGSTTTPRELRNAIDLRGVTMFALQEQPEKAAKANSSVLNRDAYAYKVQNTAEPADPLVALSELTGGLTFETRGHPLTESLLRVLRLLRERYIVDFQRPSRLDVGIHSINVKLNAKKLFVRWSGLGLPLPDPALLNDPYRVPSDTTQEPPVGKRRSLPR